MSENEVKLEPIANITQAKVLVERYRSLTLEDVIGVNPRDLTGFGSMSCTLCLACPGLGLDYEGNLVPTTRNCDVCVYSTLKKTATEKVCFCYEHEKTKPTYEKLENWDSLSDEELLQTYRDRADVLEDAIKQAEEYNKQFE